MCQPPREDTQAPREELPLGPCYPGAFLAYVTSRLPRETLFTAPFKVREREAEREETAPPVPFWHLSLFPSSSPKHLVSNTS